MQSTTFLLCPEVSFSRRVIYNVTVTGSNPGLAGSSSATEQNCFERSVVNEEESMSRLETNLHLDKFRSIRLKFDSEIFSNKSLS